MVHNLTLSEQERKEFLKRPLNMVLSGISVFMDNIHSDESKITFESDDTTFVLTATKKETRDGTKKYIK